MVMLSAFQTYESACHEKSIYNSLDQIRTVRGNAKDCEKEKAAALVATNVVK